MKVGIVVVLLYFGVIVSSSFAAPSYGWNFGEFVKGDIFEYDICDRYTLDADTALRDKCYNVTLHIIDVFEMDLGHVWLVYVEFFDGQYHEEGYLDDDNAYKAVMRDIILISESFGIDYINHKYVGDSIRNTIFWMPIHAGFSSNIRSLEVGNTIHARFADMVVTDFSRGHESIQYTLSSDEGDTITIQDDVYLPISANISQGIVSFEMELVSKHNKLEHILDERAQLLQDDKDITAISNSQTTKNTTSQKDVIHANDLLPDSSKEEETEKTDSLTSENLIFSSEPIASPTADIPQDSSSANKELPEIATTLPVPMDGKDSSKDINVLEWLYDLFASFQIKIKY